MKTHFFSRKDGFEHALLLFITLLSACTTSPQVVETEQPRHPASAVPQAAASEAVQKPAPVEVQPQAPAPQADTQPKKRKHNVEAD